MKRIYPIEAWCIDCRRCEVACKTFHSKSKNTVEAYKSEYPEPVSRIRVEGGPFLSIAVNCRHCSDPLCVEGCISGALTRDKETGLAVLDEAQCIGCGTCVSLCPYGCVHINEAAEKPFAYKCDLCSDGQRAPGIPQCVLACPNNALIYIESEGR